jgi:glycosyltransferase involved in cell wall biosynthesis
MPSFDLVIPVYNKANHISRCLDSAINQKIKFTKIILVNDGSTDHLNDILIKYKKIKNLNIINQNNKGVSNARNKGIKEAKSDFVTLLDADDELHEMYLYEIIRLYNKFLYEKPEILSCSHQNIYVADTNNKHNYKVLNTSLNQSNYPLLLYSFKKTLLCSSGITLKKELILTNLFPQDARVGEDIYIWEKVLLKNKFFFSEQILVNIYKNAENRSTGFKYEPPYYLINYKEIVSNIVFKKNILKVIFFYFFHYTSLLIEYSRYLLHDNIEKSQVIARSQNIFIRKLLEFYKLFIFNSAKKYFYFRESINELKITKSLSYSLISPSAPIVFVIMYLQGLEYLANKYLIISSGIMIVTQIFTFHSRQYLYNNVSRFNFYSFYFLRFIFLSLLLIFFYLYFFVFMKNNFFIAAISLNIVLTFWLLDYFFLFYEKYYSKKGFLKLTIIILFYYVSLIILGKNEFTYFLISSLFLIVIYTLFIIYTINFKAIKYFTIKKVLAGKITKYFFITSLFLVISNFVVRVIFEYNLNIDFLATIFFILSLSTFPSTIYNQTIGQYIKDKKTADILLFFFSILIFAIFLMMIFLFNNKQYDSMPVNLIFLLSLYSLGSYFLLKATAYKAILINNNFIGLLYKKETIFYVVNILLASLLFIDVNFSYFYMFCSGGIFLLLLNGLITNEFKLQKN